MSARGYVKEVLCDPQFSNFTDLANWNDVGVIVLAPPVVGITPARIAGAGSSR